MRSAATDFPDLAAIAAWLDRALDHERAGTFRAIRLDRIRAALAHLPAPPAPITVGGTKGKGSTVRLIEAILRAHGRDTLAFTSPHVSSIGERWRLNGIPATAADLAGPCARVADLEQATGLALTWFERTFCIAVLLAAARPGIVFLCEVGLGGRLDCANALDAAVAVITHLSHDHRDVLGPTLTHIAREKLAIARPGRPLLIAPQSPASQAAICAVLTEAETRTAAPDPAIAGELPNQLTRARVAISKGLPDLALGILLECLAEDPTQLQAHRLFLAAARIKNTERLRNPPAHLFRPKEDRDLHQQFLRDLPLLCHAQPWDTSLAQVRDSAQRLVATSPRMAAVARFYQDELQAIEARAALHRGLTRTWIRPLADPIPLALPGAHQQDNAATALAAARLVHPTLDEAHARHAMATAALAARCQFIGTDSRRIIIDGAHNGPSIAATLQVAATTLRPGWRLILGLATDKEIDEILPAILTNIPHGTPVTRCGYRSPRARGPADWPPAAQAWPWRDTIAAALADSPNQSQPTAPAVGFPNQSQPTTPGTGFPNQSQPAPVVPDSPNQSQPTALGLESPNQSQPTTTSAVAPNQFQPARGDLEIPNQSQPAALGLKSPNQSQPTAGHPESPNQSQPTIPPSHPSLSPCLPGPAVRPGPDPAVRPGPDLCITGSFYLAGEALAALGHAGTLPG